MPAPVVDKLAHALGWPDLLNVGRPGRQPRWANPYRNHWSGSAEDPQWQWAQQRGLAELVTSGEWSEWKVTRRGRAVVRLRLLAVRLAKEVSG